MLEQAARLSRLPAAEARRRRDRFGASGAAASVENRSMEPERAEGRARPALARGAPSAWADRTAALPVYC